MKRILITGANSYIGINVEKWLMKEPDQYYVETLDMKDENWRNYDFSKFDVVFHVAGIAHVSSKKKLEPLYFKVNRDLAIDTARKAKDSGVSQFIFMSSMIIYGKDNNIGDFRHVDVNKYTPINAYGQSKLEADLAIQDMSDDVFKTVIIRTPVVYGPGSKGNFPKLQKLALKAFIFPKIINQRSMIFINNLAIFIKHFIDNESRGVYYPQNKEYVKTIDIIKITRLNHKKKFRETRILNWMLKLVAKYIPIINKVFGNKTYEYIDYGLSLVAFEETLK